MFIEDRRYEPGALVEEVEWSEHTTGHMSAVKGRARDGRARVRFNRHRGQRGRLRAAADRCEHGETPRRIARARDHKGIPCGARRARSHGEADPALNAPDGWARSGPARGGASGRPRTAWPGDARCDAPRNPWTARSTRRVRAVAARNARHRARAPAKTRDNGAQATARAGAPGDADANARGGARR